LIAAYIEMRSEMKFKEILYSKKEGVARVTINRPEKYNACTPVTIYELTQALTDAWVDTSVGVVVLTGAGDRAFCTGGDQSIRAKGGYIGKVASLPLEVGWQQVSLLIRTIPKPVIARVNGFAIGGGSATFPSLPRRPNSVRRDPAWEVSTPATARAISRAP
jgi:1,4-dihydroxy-2-naphthoyl-CoA synthase